MRKFEVKKSVFRLEDEIERIIESRVTKFGSGAKVGCPKKVPEQTSLHPHHQRINNLCPKAHT